MHTHSAPPPAPALPDGVIDGDRHLYAVRVYYEDTDLSGVAYHANYLRWFERARSDLLRRLGIDQRAAVEAGEGAWAVADLGLRFLSPARLDDDVLIVTRCTELRAASCRMAQQAFIGETLCADATLRVGFVSPSGRPRRQPADWHARFTAFVTAQPARP
ncbi:YbgC/FadM family acyl-CoA thioesterase [Erythrobacteraceae bacterium CFH 75059]|uniref:YbgC/FadM family acyl-CoA thioesterase n=1 Tax=Qipengyuania thermophila TaxID=2509361 RepID=UPI00102144A8|nr:YbgC/FadM family acyl-CoA thioesterase [Qipengyuania thermophila]TCD06262.1 YbgC/FadM family acyl-CoA thioesterase [Erythrobacteraceae bacterium CFH 75059]